MADAAARQDGDIRPEIKIEDGQLSQLIDKSITALVLTKTLYVFGGRLCLIHVTKEEEQGVITRPAGAALVVYPEAVFLTELLSNAARWLRFDRRLGLVENKPQYRQTNAPRRIAEHVLARGVYPEFPRLAGIIECPTIWKGELIDRPGLHVASGLYLTACPKGYKTPPRQALLTDARDALCRLLSAINTFQFETEGDKAAAVAAIMTAVLRRPMPAAPIIAIDAPMPGTGKSLLARLISEIAIGRQGSVIALTGDESEDEKRLGAVLLAGDQIVIADNIYAEVDAPLLCSMPTESEVSIRVLGKSCNMRLPTNIVIILNGNNLVIVRDLVRRVLRIRLNANVERPEERVFPRDAIDFVHERRGSLIRDVLTIALAYSQAGEPHVGVPPFGGFEQWDRAVRRPLVWLDLPDPLGSSAGLRAIDPDVQTTAAMFTAWYESFGPAGATCAEALRTARKHTQRFDGDSEPTNPDLRDALQMAVGDKLDSRALGRWMQRHRDRIFNNLQLHQDKDEHAKVAKWVVR